jgi:hypothetical protein
MFAPRSSGEAKVPPRPTLPKRSLKRAEDDEEEAKMKVRFGEGEKENRPDSAEDGDDDKDDEDEDGGSAIMFAKMGQGARSMLGSFSSPSASPNREREDDKDEKEDEKGDEGDADMVGGVDLRVMKTYMRDLTMRLSADAAGSEGRGSGGGGGVKAKGGGTIRLYHAMNKGHQRLAIKKKNESEETKKSENENENENEEEGRKKSDRATENESESENESDGWAAKRRQLGEAKKGEPVFVWKTLTPRQNNPSALSSDEYVSRVRVHVRRVCAVVRVRLTCAR